ncbi:MAG TPA: hypothetical protein VGH28_27125 [Polyangiaceae bacterium]
MTAALGCGGDGDVSTASEQTCFADQPLNAQVTCPATWRCDNWTPNGLDRITSECCPPGSPPHQMSDGCKLPQP